MSKENIAFVVVRYGLNINGGAEYHCRMLAERLTNDYNVEVLTTCVDNYRTGENLYSIYDEQNKSHINAIYESIKLILQMYNFDSNEAYYVLL